MIALVVDRADKARNVCLPTSINRIESSFTSDIISDGFLNAIQLTMSRYSVALEHGISWWSPYAGPVQVPVSELSRLPYRRSNCHRPGGDAKYTDIFTRTDLKLKFTPKRLSYALPK